MIPDLDIHRLVKHHGQDAPIEAAMRVDAMLDKGDLDGYVVWKQIPRAVEEVTKRYLASVCRQILGRQITIG